MKPILLEAPSFREDKHHNTKITINSIPEAEQLVDECEAVANDIQRQLEGQRELKEVYGLPVTEDVKQWLYRCQSKYRFMMQKREILVNWLERQEGSYYYKLRQQRDEIRTLNDRLEVYGKWYEPINTLFQQIQKLRGKINNLEKQLKETNHA